jgi:hypothetical protein
VNGRRGFIVLPQWRATMHGIPTPTPPEPPMITVADLFPLSPEQRPENRRRRDEPAQAPRWDQPRSEAFFEDLDPAPALRAMPGPGLPLAA